MCPTGEVEVLGKAVEGTGRSRSLSILALMKASAGRVCHEEEELVPREESPGRCPGLGPSSCPGSPTSERPAQEQLWETFLEKVEFPT